MRKQFIDGFEHDERQAPINKHKMRANECFNIEKVLAEAALSELRSGNLMRFLEQVLQQVLVNLVQNALEASPHQSTIELSVVRGPTFVFHVDDRGDGLPEAVRDRVFEAGVTSKGSGSGIGGSSRSPGISARALELNLTN